MSVASAEGRVGFAALLLSAGCPATEEHILEAMTYLSTREVPATVVGVMRTAKEAVAWAKQVHGDG